MKLNLAACLIGAALSLAATPARAAAMTGDDLLGLCTSDKASDVSFCNGYIMGVIDVEEILREACPPNAIFKDADKIALTIRYLQDHAEKGGRAASPLIFEAARGSFPCSDR